MSADWENSWGCALPLRGMCDEAWYRTGLRPIFLKEQRLSQLRALKARSIPAQGEALGFGARYDYKGCKPARSIVLRQFLCLPGAIFCAHFQGTGGERYLA